MRDRFICEQCYIEAKKCCIWMQREHIPMQWSFDDLNVNEEKGEVNHGFEIFHDFNGLFKWEFDFLYNVIFITYYISIILCQMIQQFDLSFILWFFKDNVIDHWRVFFVSFFFLVLEHLTISISYLDKILIFSMI